MTLPAPARNVHMVKLTMLLSVALLLGLAADAAACSCVPPETVYRDAKVAYIARVVERTDEPPPSSRVTYTVEVERAVKGHASGRIKYRSHPSGASCGVDLEVGERVGIMEAPDAEELYSCSVVSASELERLAAPLPAARKRGRPAFLVGGMFRRFGSASLDGRGRVVRYGRRSLGLADACPGGRRFVTAGSRYTEVRRVGDLKRVRRVRAGHPTELRCLSADGRRFVAFHYRPRGGRIVLHDGTRTRRLDIAGADGEVALGRRVALARLGPFDTPSVAVVDYRSGDVRRLMRSDRLVYGLALSPGERTGFVLASGIGRGTTVSVVPLAGGEPRTVSLAEDTEDANVEWLDANRVAVAAGYSLRLFDPRTLEVTRRLDGWPYDLEARDGEIYGVTAEGKLVKATPDGIREIALLPRANLSPLVAVPRAPRAARAGLASAGAGCGWRDLRPPM